MKPEKCARAGSSRRGANNPRAFEFYLGAIFCRDAHLRDRRTGDWVLVV
jgi:hypothetical protein